jgi:hypothetical protein
MTEYSVDFVKSKVEEVRNSNSAYVFKNIFPVTPTWDKFIHHLDDAIHTFPSSTPSEPLKERIINGVIQRKLFYLMVNGPSLEYFPETLPIYKLFNEVLGGEIATASAFLNFIGREESGGIHSDGDRETIYWQCIGEAYWHIHKDLSGSSSPMEYLLSPGDVIFVGSNVIHSVRADIPRAAIGFQYRPNDPTFNNPDILQHGDANARS